MDMTNTAGSRDWLAFSYNLKFLVPHHFVSEEPISDISMRWWLGGTETLQSQTDDPLLAYVCDIAGSMADLDPAFEAAAIEGWLNDENE